MEKKSLDELAYYYFIERDFNCAESVLHCCDDYYGLNLTEQAYRLIGAYGAGLGCERTCGALCAALAVISYFKMGERAHATEGFNDFTGNFTERFRKALGSIECSELKPLYRTEEERCLKTVRLTLRELDAYLGELQAQ